MINKDGYSKSVPLSSNAEITINFDPASAAENLTVKAMGKTVHASDLGVGIRFTSIDMEKLQQCILKRMNLR